MRIIALINQKGGVGKTTSAVNLGAAFCRLGHRVLLIDMDPQANLTLHCDVHGVERSIYDTLVSDMPLEKIIVPTQLGDHLDLAPSNIDLSAAESELATLPGRERRLRHALDLFVQQYRTRRATKLETVNAEKLDEEPKPKEIAAEVNGSIEAPPENRTGAENSTREEAGVAAANDDVSREVGKASDESSKAEPAPNDEASEPVEEESWIDPTSPYDFILMDCPPSLGLLSINALALAQEVLIPLQMEFFALQGMARLMEVLKLMRRRLNPELRVGGIIPCMYDGRTNLSQEVLNEVREYFGELVFKTRIRENIRLAEAPSHGRAIFDYSPSSNGAQDYLALAQEVLTLQAVRYEQAAQN